MSIPRIAKAMDHIDDDLISGAVEYKSAKKKNTWVKWGAIAACLCLVLAFTIPTISNVLERNGGADPVEDIAPFAFNGAYYEYTDNADILEKYGLPRVLTADDAGQHFAFLQKVGAEYKETVQETDIELYDYAKVSCKGVMVIRDGDKYGAALFCNFFSVIRMIVSISLKFTGYMALAEQKILLRSASLMARLEMKNRKT